MSKRTPAKNKKSGSIFNSSQKKQQKKNLCGFNRCSDKLPPIIEQTCQYLEKRALQHEGLFRISGSKDTMRHIKDKFDKGKKVDLNKELNPNTIAGVLKLFFTELPNPVLTYELYPALMAAITINHEQLQLFCLRKVIDAMPSGNRAVIDRVCAMFQTIASFEEENKMSAKNIALVVNPAMFRDPEDSLNTFVQTGRLRVKLVEKLIIYHKELFLTKKEEMEEQSKRVTSGLDPEIRHQLDNFLNLLQQNSILLASALMNEGETELTVHFDLVNSSPKVATHSESEKLESPERESKDVKIDVPEINLEKVTPRSTTPRSSKSTPRTPKTTPSTTPRDTLIEKEDILKVQNEIKNAKVHHVLSASNSDDESDINDDSNDSSERDEIEETLEISDSPEIPRKLHTLVVFKIEGNTTSGSGAGAPILRNKAPVDVKLRNNVRTKPLLWG